MKGNIENIKEMLKKNNQEHLLTNFDNLDDEKKEELIKQIMQIDFEQMRTLYNNIEKNIVDKDEKIEPIKYTEKAKIPENMKQKYFEVGANELKLNKLAVVTMAGGQGTRLRT